MILYRAPQEGLLWMVFYSGSETKGRTCKLSNNTRAIISFTRVDSSEFSATMTLRVRGSVSRFLSMRTAGPKKNELEKFSRTPGGDSLDTLYQDSLEPDAANERP